MLELPKDTILTNLLLLKGLTHKQANIAQMASRGLSNKEISTQVNLSEKTVKYHLTKIYKVLGLKNRSQLIITFLTNKGV